MSTPLAHRVDDRYKLLRPVQAYAAAKLKEHQEKSHWTKAFIRYYEEKAQIWDKDIRAGSGKDSLRRFADQYPNFHAAADLLLVQKNMQSGERVWQMLDNCNYLYGWNGLCAVGIDYLKRGLHAAQSIESKKGEASCFKSLGDFSFLISDNESARNYWDQALLLYRCLDFHLGEANCLSGLGELSFRISDNESARSYWEEALLLYRRLGDQLGEANCLFGLGHLSFLISDNNAVRQHWEQAFPLYRGKRAKLGEANCLFGLGDLSFLRSENDAAQFHWDQALQLYRSQGAKLGEANCFFSLGDFSLRISDIESAQANWEQALQLYRDLGDHLGEANCLYRLGCLTCLEGNKDVACGYWEQSLILYRRLEEKLGEANCFSSFGDIGFCISESNVALGYYQLALNLYQEIGDQFSIACAQANIARMLFAEKKIDEGERLFHQAIDYLTSLPHYFNAAVILEWQALGYPRKKYKDCQRTCLKKAADYFERAGDKASAQRCRQELNRLS